MTVITHLLSTRRSLKKRLDRIPIPDAVTVLGIYMVLLYAIPSDRRFAALGSAGSPSTLLALGACLWWCWYHLHRNKPSLTRGPQPVRTAQYAFLAAATASYVAAALRPLPVSEATTVDSSILRIIAWAGIVFVANDGIPDMDRFLTLIRRVALAAGFLATLGLVQFATGQSFVDAVQIPGLTSGQSFSSLGDRAGFTRAAATAQSPLEYAAVLTMILPLALTLAVYDKGNSVIWRWFPVASIAPALMLSVSRSAILGMLAGIIVLFPALSRPIKLRLGLAAVGLIGGVYVAVPGMLGTLKGLFGSVGDASTTSRTDGYDLVFLFFSRSPWFGRGFGTFLPAYRILDNQYLLLLIEIGLVGLIAFIATISTAALCGLIGRRAVVDPLIRQIGQALGAGLICGLIMMAFFDALSFPMAVGTLFLLAGQAGAYWRLTRADGTSELEMRIAVTSEPATPTDS